MTPVGKNAALKKFAAGLELNLAAVIQRAEAAEKALADAQSRLAHTQAGLSIWMERSKANAAEYNEAYDAINLSDTEYGELSALAEKHKVAMAWIGHKAVLEFLEQSRDRSDSLQLPLSFAKRPKGLSMVQE